MGETAEHAEAEKELPSKGIEVPAQGIGVARQIETGATGDSPHPGGARERHARMNTRQPDEDTKPPQQEHVEREDVEVGRLMLQREGSPDGAKRIVAEGGEVDVLEVDRVFEDAGSHGETTDANGKQD